MNEEKRIKKIVKNKYSKIANEKSSCCSCGCENESISRNIGYSDDDIAKGEGANFGLGCGNPVGISKIKERDIVLDLGCGGGFDCFLASEKVGKEGKVIGVDMTKEMIEKAKMNAKKRSVNNVEFILSEIEKLPIEDDSIDVITTNCVINLTPDKTKTFKEAFRVLKRGGKMYISDIVLLRELSQEQKNDEELLAGCVAGALLKEDYLKKIKEVGFDIRVLSENEKINNNGLPVESLTIELIKRV